MATANPPIALIIDDDRAVQRLLADALSKQGFTVAVERDGEWALRTFEKRVFDVVLLDLLLPGVNGYEVARKMRESPRGRKTPIVMLSGVYRSPLHQKEAVEKHGAYAFLEKPVKLTHLYDVLRGALGDRYPNGASAPAPARPAAPAQVAPDKLADRSADEEVTAVEAVARQSPSSAQAVALRGNFRDKPFPEVLAEVSRWKATGALLLKREKVKKIVYFRDGVPLSVKSNLLSECLGRVMVKERMISEAECEESLRRMKGQSRQQGTLLMEMGCINPHNLVYALSLQLQTKLFEVFGWPDGDYQFNAAVQPPPDTVGLEMTSVQVICEGVRRSFDARRMKEVFGPSVESLYAHRVENPLSSVAENGLGEEELSLLRAIDGFKTVSTLRALALLSPLDTDRFVYAMKCAGVVELKASAAEGKPRPLANIPPPKPLLAPPKLPPAPQKPPPLATPRRNSKPQLQRAEPVMARAAAPLLPELSSTGSLVSHDEGVIRERLAAKAAAFRKQDYFEILGVAQNANREEIKRAYFALAKEYHPEKHFASASAEIRQLAKQLYELISTAHDVLSDPTERQRYLEELKSGTRKNMGEDVQRILAAEAKFQKGEDALRQRLVPQAHQLFREAVSLYGEEGEFHAYLGWSQFQLAPNDPATIDTALNALDRAVSLNPKLDKSYLFLGQIYKATGRPDKAERQFEKAIQCNPDCTDALRELRLLGKQKR